MANPRRVQKVAQQMKRELSMLLIQDKARTVARLSAVHTIRALSPEERLGADAAISTLVSVMDVRLSGDLQVAKVYLSFFAADGRGEDIAFEGLQRLEGYLRSQVGKAMGLQRVPELRLLRDDSLQAVANILDQLRVEEGGGEGNGGDSALPPLEDDGIITVG